MLILIFLLHRYCYTSVSQAVFCAFTYKLCVMCFPGELHLGSGQPEDLDRVQSRHSKLV